MLTSFSPPRRQRGDMLLEALVGVLITSVIGAGLAHVAGGVLNSQRDAKVENLVVEHLRDRLQHHGVGLCAGGSFEITLPAGQKPKVSVACEAVSATIRVGGIERVVKAPKRVDLSVSASDLGSKAPSEDDPPLLLSSRQ
jgi:type II secretory pathway pseudopilin PulG